jgi:hypothetical protein
MKFYKYPKFSHCALRAMGRKRGKFHLLKR